MAVDWVTVSSLATAAGTLVLAIATFGSVRSANRAARVAERTLLLGQRPLLFPSRLDDPMQKFQWADEHRAALGGGRALAEIEGDIVYVAASLRNVGNGTAVIQGWLPIAERVIGRIEMPDPSAFRMQTRDLYVPSGGIGFWQAAMRDADDPERPAVTQMIVERRIFGIALLYSDHEGGQRSIGWFSMTPAETTDEWLFALVRHWNVDGPNPH